MLDRDISAAGVDNLVGTSRLLFVALEITAIGGLVRDSGDGQPDHILRAGWFSIGDNFSVDTGPLMDWWRPPVWIDFEDLLWTPSPSYDAAGGALALQATRFRWWLSPGTTAHVYIFGV